MNKAPIRIHRGVDNKVHFRTFDPDRKPVNICGLDIYARIISTHERVVVLEKLCKLGSATGLVTLELNEGDLQDMHAGTYTMVLIATKPFIYGADCNTENTTVNEVISKALFTDLSNNIEFTVEVTEQAFRQPYPTQEIHAADWTPGAIMPISTPWEKYFYSKAIPGSRVHNHKEGIHTFTIFGTELSGRLEILGTLEPNPTADPDPMRWFKIYPSSMSPDVLFDNWSGTEAFTFQANFMWLKFRWIPIASKPSHKPTKLLVRT